MSLINQYRYGDENSEQLQVPQINVASPPQQEVNLAQAPSSLGASINADGTVNSVGQMQGSDLTQTPQANFADIDYSNIEQTTQQNIQEQTQAQADALNEQNDAAAAQLQVTPDPSLSMPTFDETYDFNAANSAYEDLFQQTKKRQDEAFLTPNLTTTDTQAQEKSEPSWLDRVIQGAIYGGNVMQGGLYDVMNRNNTVAPVTEMMTKTTGLPDLGAPIRQFFSGVGEFVEEKTGITTNFDANRNYTLDALRGNDLSVSNTDAKDTGKAGKSPIGVKIDASKDKGDGWDWWNNPTRRTGLFVDTGLSILSSFGIQGLVRGAVGTGVKAAGGSALAIQRATKATDIIIDPAGEALGAVFGAGLRKVQNLRPKPKRLPEEVIEATIVSSTGTPQPEAPIRVTNVPPRQLPALAPGKTVDTVKGTGTIANAPDERGMFTFKDRNGNIITVNPEDIRTPGADLIVATPPKGGIALPPSTPTSRANIPLLEGSKRPTTSVRDVDANVKALTYSFASTQPSITPYRVENLPPSVVPTEVAGIVMPTKSRYEFLKQQQAIEKPPKGYELVPGEKLKPGAMGGDVYLYKGSRVKGTLSINDEQVEVSFYVDNKTERSRVTNKTVPTRELIEFKKAFDYFIRTTDLEGRRVVASASSNNAEELIEKSLAYQKAGFRFTGNGIEMEYAPDLPVVSKEQIRAKLSMSDPNSVTGVDNAITEEELDFSFFDEDIDSLDFSNLLDDQLSELEPNIDLPQDIPEVDVRVFTGAMSYGDLSEVISQQVPGTQVDVAALFQSPRSTEDLNILAERMGFQFSNVPVSRRELVEFIESQATEGVDVKSIFSDYGIPVPTQVLKEATDVRVKVQEGVPFKQPQADAIVRQTPTNKTPVTFEQLLRELNIPEPKLNIVDADNIKQKLDLSKPDAIQPSKTLEADLAKKVRGSEYKKEGLIRTPQLAFLFSDVTNIKSTKKGSFLVYHHADDDITPILNAVDVSNKQLEQLGDVGSHVLVYRSPLLNKELRSFFSDVNPAYVDADDIDFSATASAYKRTDITLPFIEVRNTLRLKDEQRLGRTLTHEVGHTFDNAFYEAEDVPFSERFNTFAEEAPTPYAEVNAAEDLAESFTEYLTKENDIGSQRQAAIEELLSGSRRQRYIDIDDLEKKLLPPELRTGNIETTASILEAHREAQDLGSLTQTMRQNLEQLDANLEISTSRVLETPDIGRRYDPELRVAEPEADFELLNGGSSGSELWRSTDGSVYRKSKQEPLEPRRMREEDVLRDLQDTGIAPLLLNETEDSFDMFAVEGMPLTKFYRTADKNTIDKVVDNIIKATDILKNKGYLHTDLHSGNVIVAPDLSVKLIDFQNALSLKHSFKGDEDKFLNEAANVHLSKKAWKSLLEEEVDSGVSDVFNADQPAQVFMHGTRVDLPDDFDPIAGGKRAEYGSGFYLTTNADLANKYALADVSPNLPNGTGRTYAHPSVYAYRLEPDAYILDASYVPADLNPFKAAGVNVKPGSTIKEAYEAIDRYIVRNKLSEVEAHKTYEKVNRVLQSKYVSGIRDGETLVLFDSKAAKKLYKQEVKAIDDVLEAAANRYNVDSHRAALNPKNIQAQVDFEESAVKLQAEMKGKLETDLEAAEIKQRNAVTKLLDEQERIELETTRKRELTEQERAATRLDRTKEEFDKLTDPDNNFDPCKP